MAHHHDLFHLERCDRKLQRGRDAVQAAAFFIGRHQGCHIANGEQLPRRGIEDHCRVGAAVGAGDDHRRRLLAIAQPGEQVARLAVPAGAKAAVAGDQILGVVSEFDGHGARLANVRERIKLFRSTHD